MSTLDAYAKFLTARWDEIEANEDHTGYCATLYGHGECDCRVAYTLADLAAKRAILAHVMMQPPFLAHGETEARAPWFIVTLAEPFRDHPDHPANQKPRVS